VIIVTSETNLGSLEAWNQGTQVASGQYLVLMHNDSEPQEGWLEALAELVERDPSVGAVGAKLLQPDGRLQEAGGIVCSDGTLRPCGRGMDAADPGFNFVREVDYCSHAALLVRGSLWREIGGFDVGYAPGSYYEVVDLCFSIRKSGFRVLYQPATTVIHHGHAAQHLTAKAGAGDGARCGSVAAVA
jgi:GT2 family glycosyltransferase